MSKKLEIVDKINMAKCQLECIDYLYEKFMDDLAAVPEPDSLPDDVRQQIWSYKGRIRIVSGVICEYIMDAKGELEEAVKGLEEW